jgi:tetratricopeptide (TPR) repeat protein
MSLFQIILLLLAGFIFYIFFKKLYSGNYPKRGVDYEAKLPNEQIGSVSNPTKIFSKEKPILTRIDELVFQANEAIGKKDYDEAMKALRSAYIIDNKNTDVICGFGIVYFETGKLEDAKNYFEKALGFDENCEIAKDMLKKLS